MKSFKRLVSLLFTAFLTLALFPLTAMAAAPTMSAEVDQFNRLIITFSEGVYGDASRSMAVNSDDFVLTFTSKDRKSTRLNSSH